VQIYSRGREIQAARSKELNNAAKN